MGKGRACGEGLALTEAMPLERRSRPSGIARIACPMRKPGPWLRRPQRLEIEVLLTLLDVERGLAGVRRGHVGDVHWCKWLLYRYGVQVTRPWRER